MEVLDQKINELSQRARATGEIGIEIETEGKNLPHLEGNDIWRGVADGSLRNGGIEYVLRAPVMHKDVDKALKNWKEAVNGATFDFSLRTSVHIHVNVGHFTVRQVLTMFSVYWLLENVLVGLNGKDRVGNLFCLRVKDAESLPLDLVKNIGKKRFLDVCTEHYRYSALNPAAIMKYGSAEFRFIKGTSDINRIKFWVDALFKMVKLSADFKDPKTVLEFFDQGRTEFMRHFLTIDAYEEVLKTYPMTYIDMLGENYVHVLNLIRAMQNAMDRQDFFRPYIASDNEDLDNGDKIQVPTPKKKPFLEEWHILDEPVRAVEEFDFDIEEHP